MDCVESKRQLPQRIRGAQLQVVSCGCGFWRDGAAESGDAGSNKACGA
jgi:hypothetical protein